MSCWRAVVLTLALPIALTACDPAEHSGKSEPPRPVVIHTVAPASATINRSFSGNTAAADSAELGFEVAGRITRILAVEGRRYQSGEVLAQLDVSTYEAQLRQAEAEATRATEDLRRIQQLFESDNSSRSQFDGALATQKAASAALSAAQKKVADGTIVMPYAGIIGEVLKDPQEFVSAGTAAFRIQGDGGMEFQIGVPADVIRALRVGHKSTIVLGSIPDQPVEATVSKISPQVSQNTTYPVVLTVDSTHVDLRDGMDGEATFELPNPHGSAVTIPIEAVVGSPGATTFVWVVESPQSAQFGIQGTLSRREVTCGALRASGHIEILAGLRAGDSVVTRGVHRVTAGLLVRIAVPTGTSATESSLTP